MTQASSSTTHPGSGRPPSNAPAYAEFKLGAVGDVVTGFRMWELWGRQCYNEVRRRYRRTLLGPMWVTVSMGVFALALSIVWSNLWKQSITEYLPFVLSGMIPWMMISSCLGESCTTFISGESIMKSRQFPYTILIHTVVGRNLILFFHNMVAFVLVGVVVGLPINLNTLMTIPGILLLTLNLSWISLLLAIVCLRYRDFQQLVTIVLQISMFVTPVFWPAEQLTGRAKILVDANVLYHLIDIVRSPLLGHAVGIGSYVICVILALIGWSGTIWIFSRKRHRLVYWL